MKRENRGRPKKQGEILSEERAIKFSPSMMEQLQKRSAQSGVSVAEQVRRAVAAQLHPASSDIDDVPGGRILGPIPAGAPDGQEEYEDMVLRCSLHPSGPEYAYVHVKGDSMDKIVPSGAYALVRKKWAMSGEVIAAVLTMPGGQTEVTLKTLRVDKDNQVRLEPCSTNPHHKPIVLSPTKPRGDVIWIKPECGEIAGVFTGDYVVAVG